MVCSLLPVVPLRCSASFDYHIQISSLRALQWCVYVHLPFSSGCGQGPVQVLLMPAGDIAGGDFDRLPAPFLGIPAMTGGPLGMGGFGGGPGGSGFRLPGGGFGQPPGSHPFQRSRDAARWRLH